MVILRRVGPFFLFLLSTAVFAKDVPLPPAAIVPSVLREFDPSIASDGRNFLAVWISDSVRAARVDRSGQLIDHDSLVISNQPTNTTRVTWIGSAYLVVYSGSYALVSSSGDVVKRDEKFPLAAQYLTAIAWNGR